MAVPVPIFTKF